MKNIYLYLNNSEVLMGLELGLKKTVQQKDSVLLV